MYIVVVLVSDKYKKSVLGTQGQGIGLVLVPAVFNHQSSDHFFQSEREEKRGAAIARFEAMKAWNAHLREKNQRLRAKYIAVVDMYNTLAEEAKERSDSSSSSDEEQDDNCCIM